ncbi:hypothetical protein [Acidovorax sp. SRB_24]|uniref:hypothetical protein n=1 Tax=Acidovorax sp. SRB_24 TaxID=1962700 RepID=UPI00145D3681|nr:hypothetical protein [Acidovorax sp. SRB_24]
MKIQVMGIALRAVALISPIALVACGGGDGPSACNNPNPAVCAAVGGAPSGSTGNNNNTNTNTNAGTLFTTAPTDITLNAGTSVTYGVGGGNPPYTATSGNANVGTASMSGTTLSLNSIAAGKSPVVVVDSRGKIININLTVAAQGQAGKALSVAPVAITVGNCTTNIPFIFSGGVEPYTIFSSDNFNVPVSSPLLLDSSLRSFYFTASTKYGARPGDSIPFEPVKATLTVLDGLSRTATVTIDIPTFNECPKNPILKVFPESANFRASERRSFQITGGPSPVDPDGRAVPLLLPIVTIDPAFATVVERSATSFTVQAAEPGALPRSTLMTVATPADGQRTSVVITVLPQP